MRLPLQGGEWAELRDRLSYEQGRAVRAALLDVDHDRRAMADLDLALCRAYVAAWNVTGLDGAPVPPESPESAPDDVVQAIASAALKAWKGRLGPKGTNAPLPSTPPALP